MPWIAINAVSTWPAHATEAAEALSLSPIGNGDALESVDGPDGPYGQGGQQDKGQRPVSRSEPWGHRGMPPKGARAYALRFGSSNVIFFGIAPTEKYGPQDLEAGETTLYCSTIRLDKDGNIKIDAAAGVDVNVNGGGAKVAPLAVLLATRVAISKLGTT